MQPDSLSHPSYLDSNLCCDAFLSSGNLMRAMATTGLPSRKEEKKEERKESIWRNTYIVIVFLKTQAIDHIAL